MALPETRVRILDRRLSADDVDELDFYQLESGSVASEKAIFDYAFAPGSEQPRTQRPQRDPDQIIDDPALWDEGEIFDSAFNDGPQRGPLVYFRRSAKE